MNDDMSDLAPALLMTVIIAIGIVAYQFRAEFLATPAQASVVKVEKLKIDKSTAQVASTDRLYWIR